MSGTFEFKKWIDQLIPYVCFGRTKTEQELHELFRERDDLVVPEGIRTDFFRISYELKSEVARRLNYLVPQIFRPVSSAILSSIFDKKILNLDTEHFKKVGV